jgi:hypothetical protein
VLALQAFPSHSILGTLHSAASIHEALVPAPGLEDGSRLRWKICLERIVRKNEEL